MFYSSPFHTAYYILSSEELNGNRNLAPERMKAVPFVRRIAFGSSDKTASVPQLQPVWNSPFLLSKTFPNAKKRSSLS